MQSKGQNSVDGGSRKLSNDGSSSESLAEETCSDSSENRNKASKKGRCRKKPKSRSSAAEMLQFLKSYSERREKMEEEKLKVLKEMKEEKISFFNRFFEYMDNR